MSLKQMGGPGYMPNMMQKTVRILIENDIQFDVDILSDNLTCGWLTSQVINLYTELVRENNKLAAQMQSREKDFHQIV